MSSFCKLLSRVSRSRARTASRARAPSHQASSWCAGSPRRRTRVPYKPTVGTRALRQATRRSKFALGPRATSPLQSEVLCDRAVPAARAAPSATRLTSRRIFVCTFSHNSKRWGERGADARAVAMFPAGATRRNTRTCLSGSRGDRATRAAARARASQLRRFTRL